MLNRLSSVTNKAGEKTCYGYDRITGKINSITDPAGNQRTYRYNDAGELTEQTDIQGNVTHYDYNVLGKLRRITDGAGRVTKHIYQPGGRLEKTIYPNGREISYGYDGLGRISSKTYKSGYSEKYAYDEAGRVILVSGSGGRKKSYTYDAMGRVDSMTDALGNTTRYTYTLNGKLREVVDALGNRAEYRYDEMDKLIHICQHGKNRETDRVSEYIRDVFGQVVCIKDALGMEECYRYDVLGRVVEKTDRDENVTSYVYRPDGKIERILYGDGRQSEFSYTPLGQISTIKDWLGETKIERNPQGKPERITDHNGQSICYQWGKFGERTQMVYPDGTVLYYHYDNMLRLTELENDKAGREKLHLTYGYDKEGRISWKNNGAGYCTRWSYNDQGLPCELLHEDNRGIWDRYRYQYDARGNKTEIQKERRGLPEESGCYHYGYDSLGRLTEVEKDGDLLRSYAYDSFGNRIGKTDFRRNLKNLYTYDALNRLKEEEIIFQDTRLKKNYDYDRRGNLVGEYQENELCHGYQFGAINRLEKAWNEAGAEAKYFYNGLGQRTGRMDGDTKEKYLLDLTKTYYNLLGVETSEKKQKYYWDYNVAATEEEGNMLQYYLQDELGSPLRILYSTGKGETYGYDEFGEDLYQPGKEEKFGNRYSQQGEHQPFGYTGYRYDNVSGTYFAQAREFRPDLGRFTAEDLVRGRGVKPKTLNRYGYCWGNPLHYIDLDGRETSLIDKIIDGYADDDQAKELVETYVYGDGEDVVYDNDEDWSAYMMDNDTLRERTEDYLANIRFYLELNESVDVDITTSVIIDDEDSHSGYMLLYGSNGDVGGYQMHGTVSKDGEGVVTYDMTYTFNDIMDPNNNHKEDIIAGIGLKILQLFNDKMTLEDYNIQITWQDVTTIFPDDRDSTGWLKNMSFTNIDSIIAELKALESVTPFIGGGQEKKRYRLQLQFYEDLKKFMAEHPEYYSCSTE